MVNPSPCTMGCTSSAPNTAATNMNATEKSVQSDRDNCNGPLKKDASTMYADEEYGINDIKVLPTCDTLAEPIQLDSNNKSMIETSNFYQEQEATSRPNDLPIIEHVVESENDPKVEDKIQIEEKISSIEDAVGKVVGLFVSENAIDKLSEQKTSTDTSEGKLKDIDSGVENSDEQAQSDSEANNQYEDAKGAASPSQSTSSHATRWEALADIAAELPPSLAVDPLTGQIYALSK